MKSDSFPWKTETRKHKRGQLQIFHRQHKPETTNEVNYSFPVDHTNQKVGIMSITDSQGQHKPVCTNNYGFSVDNPHILSR